MLHWSQVQSVAMFWAPEIATIDGEEQCTWEEFAEPRAAGGIPAGWAPAWRPDRIRAQQRALVSEAHLVAAVVPMNHSAGRSRVVLYLHFDDAGIST